MESLIVAAASGVAPSVGAASSDIEQAFGRGCVEAGVWLSLQAGDCSQSFVLVCALGALCQCLGSLVCRTGSWLVYPRFVL